MPKSTRPLTPAMQEIVDALKAGDFLVTTSSYIARGSHLYDRVTKRKRWDKSLRAGTVHGLFDRGLLKEVKGPEGKAWYEHFYMLKEGEPSA